MATAPRKKTRQTYHHGNLRQAIVDATVALVEEGGAESVTIREAARRAGVSSGAPFRHFATKQDLMTAVAEDAMARLRKSIERQLTAEPPDCPFTRLLLLADGYLRWAIQFPTHYRIVGDRSLVDFYGSPDLQRDNLWIRDVMAGALSDAVNRNLLRPCDLAVVTLQARALAYGLARMYTDGHMREFGISKSKARGTMLGALKDFILSLARDPRAAARRIDTYLDPI